MRVDLDYLEAHAAFREAGREERARPLDLPGGERSFAVLYLPDEAPRLGFVVCHSYGFEHLTLRRFEVELARALVRAGHAAMTFHCRGYGDATGDFSDARLATHLEDAQAAVEAFRGETGVASVGLAGERFGGLVAALAAERPGVDHLALVAPVVKPPKFFSSLMRQKVVAALVDAGGERVTVESLLEEMRRDGVVDVLGYPVHRAVYDETEGLDLAERASTFGGRALVVQVSRRPKPDADVEALVARMREGGASVETGQVLEPAGVQFGQPAYVGVQSRSDSQAELVARLAGTVTSWAGASVASAAQGGTG